MILETWNMQGGHTSIGRSTPRPAAPAAVPAGVATAAVPAAPAPKRRAPKRKQVEGDADTVNLAGIMNKFRQNKLDVICLQEAGACPDYLDFKVGHKNGVQYLYGTYTPDGGKRRKVPTRESCKLTLYFMWFDTGLHGGRSNNRCSLAILSKEKPIAYDVIKKKSAPTLRPLIGVQLGGNQWVYSIHAPSGNHKAASGVADSLLKKIKAPKYVCAGDFNCEPASMTARGHQTFYSEYLTHERGGKLDFLVAKGCRVRTANEANLDPGVEASDHFSQAFEVT